MKAATLARWEHRLRPYITRLGPRFVTKLYSSKRRDFIKKLVAERPEPYVPPQSLEQTLWGIKFRAPLFNAAGMFKNGEGYELVARQGAGAYLVGTTTAEPRTGNEKDGIHCPFVPYPRSRIASNWLGLPNNGHAAVAEVIADIDRVDGCPMGASVMASPGRGEEGLEELVKGMFLYEDAGVDFIEMNESCPNTGDGKQSFDELAKRLDYVKNNFLAYRSRRLPVIVKLSNDTGWGDVLNIVDLLLKMNFDGLNFGNTSTRYGQARKIVDEKEQKLYDYFTTTYGGGISGEHVRQTSVILTNFATGYLYDSDSRKRGKGMVRKGLLKHVLHTDIDYEFHVIRTGGVATAEDLEKSRFVSALLTQWFTGYFERFAEHGHDVYKYLYDGYINPTR